MIIVSIISAVDYFVAFWKKIDHASNVNRKSQTSVLNRRKEQSGAARPEQPSSAL